MSSDQFISPLKIEKVNIGSSENPKFSNIGYYQDDETVGKITDLLHEFQDLFPTKFSEMKGIIEGLGEIKIPLRPDAKPVKQWSYRLNPCYKEKVKVELDRGSRCDRTSQRIGMDQSNCIQRQENFNGSDNLC